MTTHQTKEDTGEVNQTLLVINFRISSAERIVGGAFINLNDRQMLITEFLDNEHLSSLESFIIQMNNSSTESKFKVLINMPQDLMKEKVQDLLQMCEVDHILANKKDFDIKNTNNTLGMVLKDNINYKIEESEMELAMGCLEAGIEHLNLRTGNQK